ncbi:MAG TPA: sugar ABC transporter ATP-binding protein [Firmicutes bacterium]|nr:sugar ABC transporter ATP-binding protein [Bacillota bacterium]
MGDGPLLKMVGITKEFPGVKALKGVDFELRAGEVHVLVGENGAGKSTLMKILSGVYRPDSGRILINGKEVQITSPRKAQESGIATIYQEFNLIPYLSIVQNIFLGRELMTNTAIPRMNYREMRVKAKELLDSLGIQISPDTLVKDLSMAQRQMIEVAKALSLEARILIMDEPTSALTSREIEHLFDIVRALKASGMGIIYISHRLEEIERIGDRVTVLRDGEVIGTKDVSGLSTEELITMMVGREIGDLFPRERVSKGEVALKVEHLSRRNVVKDVSLEVHYGEIVGLAGLVGSGRTELARLIFGADRFDHGEIVISGRRVKGDHNPSASVRSGLSFLPEDRKEQGLCLSLSVANNVILASLRRLFPHRITSPRREMNVTLDYVRKLRIAIPSPFRAVKSLSGGNQQKVVLAKWLCTQSKVFIFDEPTRGIDVAAKAEIHGLMNELAEQGAAILMISSELPEILGMSDRIYVMHEGRIVKEFTRDEATQEEILRYAMGGVGGAA